MVLKAPYGTIIYVDALSHQSIERDSLSQLFFFFFFHFSVFSVFSFIRFYYEFPFTLDNKRVLVVRVSYRIHFNSNFQIIDRIHQVFSESMKLLCWFRSMFSYGTSSSLCEKGFIAFEKFHFSRLSVHSLEVINNQHAHQKSVLKLWKSEKNPTAKKKRKKVLSESFYQNYVGFSWFFFFLRILNRIE